MKAMQLFFILLICSCNSGNKTSYLLHQKALEDFALMDIFIISAHCNVDSKKGDTLIINLVDTSYLPYSELDVLRSNYIVAGVLQYKSFPDYISFKTEYPKYEDTYILTFDKAYIVDILKYWDAQPIFQKGIEFALTNFNSYDWALLSPINDSLSNYFVEYDTTSVIVKLINALELNQPDEPSPTADDKLALLYELCVIYDPVTASKLDSVLSIMNYHGHKDTKHVRRQFTRASADKNKNS